MERRSKHRDHLFRVRLKIILTGMLLCGSLASFPFQNPKIDSLKSVLADELSDHDRINTYNLLAFHTYRIFPDTAEMYARWAMQLSRKTDNDTGKAKSHNSFGFIAFSRGAYDSALWHYQQFSQISQSTGDSVSMANALNNLGILYRNQGLLGEALVSYEQSLEIRKSIGSETGLGPMYNNLGLLHTNLGNYREGIDFYLKAIEAKRAPDRMTGRAMAYINLANLKVSLEDYKGSREAFEKAFSIYNQYNDKKGMAISYHNLGRTYSRQDSLSKALTYFQRSVKINQALKNPKQLAENLNAIAGLKYRLKEWDSCAYYLSEAQTITSQLKVPHVRAKVQLGFGELYRATGKPNMALAATTKAYDDFMAIRTKKEIAESSLLLSKLYAELGNEAKAYDFLKTHMSYNDSLINENKVAEIAKIQFKYDLAKVENEKEQLIKVQQELDSTLTEKQQQLTSQRQTIIFGGIALGLVLISALFIWHFYQQARKTRNSLREANDEISELNQSLEQKILDRTERIKKQNQQLMDYAFAISHEIRSPLTNLIGFLDLEEHDEKDHFSDEEKKQIKTSMVNSIQKIDEATRKAAQIGNSPVKRSDLN